MALAKQYVISILLLLTSITSLTAQRSFLRFELEPGIRLFSQEVVGTNPSSYLSLTPELGLRWRLNKKVSVGYKKSVSWRTTNINYKREYENFFGSEYLEMNKWDVLFRKPLFNKIVVHYGCGYFSLKRISQWHILTKGFWDYKYKGLSLNLGIETKRFNLTFNKLIELTPTFDVLDPYHYEFSLNTKIPLFQKDDFDFSPYTQTDDAKIKFYPFFSFRVSPNKYYSEGKELDLYHPIALYPGIGIAAEHTASGITVLVSRDMWLAMTGGLRSNDVIGNIGINNFGFRYRLTTKRNNVFHAGLALEMISNQNEPFITVNTETGPDQNGNISTYEYRRYLNVRGFGVSFAYSLPNHFLLEYRQIFPLSGSPFFTMWYSSIGIIYEWRN